MIEFYPDVIRDLPEADVPIEGVVGHLLQAADHQVVFFDIDPIAQVPRHSHGPQWGVMLEGEMDLTIGGETRRIRKGDSYFIPAGVEHQARFLTRCYVLDLFAEPARYKPRA